jgi:hypothetical protein
MKHYLILYRQGDADDAAQAVLERMRRRFGSSQIALVGDGSAQVRGGASDQAHGLMAGCWAVLALIGPHWVGSAGADGSRLLDDPSDGVRRLLATALASKEILVIPVLVNGAEMPSAVDLPADVQGLAFRNAAPARPGALFLSDTERVIQAIVSFLPLQRRLSYPRFALVMAVAALLEYGAFFGFLGTAILTSPDPNANANAVASVSPAFGIGDTLLVLTFIGGIVVVVGWGIGLLQSLRMRAWGWAVWILLLGFYGFPTILFAAFGPREPAVAKTPIRSVS